MPQSKTTRILMLQRMPFWVSAVLFLDSAGLSGPLKLASPKGLRPAFTSRLKPQKLWREGA